MYQAVGQDGVAALYTKWFTTRPAAQVPMEAPRPLVMSMNRPWALERMPLSVFSFT